MDNFIVSARKYRPTTFKSVVGQDSITATLKNAIKTNQIAQAFLFCGPRGVGKTTCARIFAEEDALRIIATKSDGALRDALSIFDQLVNFSGNNLTYKSTIQSLNVLDVDNYFSMTDYLFSENKTSALLLFEEILTKGFDGQHFIAGLAGHFRNLLVAQNQSTVQLMEVSDSVKVKFIEQAKKIDSLLLIRALELANNCDFNYKLSNNKRLSVEICLLQINANYIHSIRPTVRQSREGK